MQSNAHRWSENFVVVTDFFKKPPWLFWATLTVIFAAAFAIRIYFFNASRAVGEVQYRSATIARAFYFDRVEPIPEWRKEINRETLRDLPTKEPSITEYLASWLYWLSGGEHLWLARLLTTSFWLIGSALLFTIIKQNLSCSAAICGVAYYLFIPIGVFLSTSFQPDSLMIMMFLAALLSILHYGYQPSSTRLVLAGVTSGLAVLVKPLCLFAIGFAFLFVVLHHRKALGYKVILHLASFSSLLILIGGTYYLYGILVGSDLQNQAEVSFVPALLIDRGYWSGWFSTATSTAGMMPILLALLGFPLLSSGVMRALVSGLWIGYVIFCLIFTYHIRFNSYYHAQLIVIVALSFGPIVIVVLGQLEKGINHRRWWLPVILAFTLLATFTIRDIRDHFRYQLPVETVHVASKVGQLVGHSSQTVYVASYYGRPLMYLGELSGVYWPRRITTERLLQEAEARELTVQERLDALGFWPEYVIITDFVEFQNHHQDLREFLRANCSLKSRSEQYLIYHLCER